MKQLVLAMLMLFALPQWAAGQCSSIAYAVDQSENGSLRMAAATTQQGCNGTRTVHVRAWKQICVEKGGVWDPILQVCDPGPDTPIIIATGKSDDYKLTSAKDGVFFDLNADGFPEKVAWTLPNAEVAFLAIDRDGDGQITSGRELFGNHTHPEAGDGFAALIFMTKEANNGIALASVSADDPLYAQLLLWTDSNHNGISEPAELRPVSDLFTDVGLGYDDHLRKDGNGNQYLYRGWVYVRTGPGRNRPDPEDFKEINERRRFIYDVALATVP